MTLVAIRRDYVSLHRECYQCQYRTCLHALTKILHKVDLEIDTELFIHERRAEERVGTKTLAQQDKERDETLDHVENGVHEHVLVHAIAFEVLSLVGLVLDDESDDEVEDKASKADDGKCDDWADEFHPLENVHDVTLGRISLLITFVTSLP